MFDTVIITQNGKSVNAGYVIIAQDTDRNREEPIMWQYRKLHSAGSFGMAICLAVSLLNQSAFSVPAQAVGGNCGADAKWELNDGELRITGTGAVTGRGWSGQTGKIQTVVIENGITSMPENAFNGYSKLTSVTMPQTLTQIESFFCYDCPLLKTVVFSDALTMIPAYSFYRCSSLTGVQLPAKLTSVQKEAFSNCIGLKALSVPDGVQTIGEKAFYATNIKTLTLNEGLTKIEKNAFDMSCFQSVKIPDTVTSIGANAFGIVYDLIYAEGSKFYGSYSSGGRVKIIGSAGSEAERYAKEYNHPFSTSATDNPHTHTGTWVTDPEPTCTKDGQRYYICSICGEKITETLPATGHSWSAWKTETESSCGKEGTMVRVCTKCGEKEYDVIDAKEHSWSPWSVDLAATCTEDGRSVRTCWNCGEKEYDVIPATGHRWSEWTVETEATCGKVGERVRSCANCGAKQYETIPALAHDWSDWKTVSEPSCGKEGERVRRCANCGQETHESIPALSHNWTGWEVEIQAGCEAEGKRVRKCTNCGAEEHEAIAPLEHNWSDWKEEIPATCETDGTLVHVCSNCGKTEKQVIPATGHEWLGWTVETPADCEHMGRNVRVCSKCKEKQYEDVPALGHQWSEWTTVLEPTLTSEGRREKVCRVCGAVVSETIPRLPGYSVTVTAGEGGKVSPIGETVVAEDGSITISITPDSGYSIAAVILDGTAQAVSNMLVLSHITSPHTVAVSFLKNVVEQKPVCVGVLTEAKKNIWLTEEKAFSMSDFTITAMISENGKTSSLDITGDCSPQLTPHMFEESRNIGEVSLPFRYNGNHSAVKQYFEDQTVAVPIGVVIRGDANLDGSVDAYDSSITLLTCTLEMVSLPSNVTSLQRAAMDADLDGQVLPYDSSAILTFFVMRFSGFGMNWDDVLHN